MKIRVKEKCQLFELCILAFSNLTCHYLVCWLYFTLSKVFADKSLFSFPCCGFQNGLCSFCEDLSFFIGEQIKSWFSSHGKLVSQSSHRFLYKNMTRELFFNVPNQHQDSRSLPLLLLLLLFSDLVVSLTCLSILQPVLSP